MVLGTAEIIAIALKVLEEIKEHTSFGKMKNFRTKASDGTWVSGNNFEDDSYMFMVELDLSVVKTIVDVIGGKSSKNGEVKIPIPGANFEQPKEIKPN
jgi:hypothetical protein